MPNEFVIKNGFISQGNSTINGNLTLNGSLSFSGNPSIDTSWTAYTPTWTSDGTQPTLGNGTLTGFYKQIGKLVCVRVIFIFGTTSNSGTGTWRFSLPIAAASADGVQLPCSLMDNATNWYTGVVNGTFAGNTTYASIITTSSPSGYVSGTVPFTWGAYDAIMFNGTYESI